ALMCARTDLWEGRWVTAAPTRPRSFFQTSLKKDRVLLCRKPQYMSEKRPQLVPSTRHSHCRFCEFSGLWACWRRRPVDLDSLHKKKSSVCSFENLNKREPSPLLLRIVCHEYPYQIAPAYCSGGLGRRHQGSAPLC